MSVEAASLRNYLQVWRDAFRFSLKSLSSGELSKLGAKKIIGKILQPVNSPTRIPEYALFFSVLSDEIRKKKAKWVLDISSPKLFSLLLAEKSQAKFLLTDPYAPAVEEAEVLAKSMDTRVQDRIRFRVVDASAEYYVEDRQGELFDIIYSMSVVEHILPESGGDVDALRNLAKYLNKDGTLVVSMPVGPSFHLHYVDDEIYGRGAGETGKVFFQRVYDAERLRSFVQALSDEYELTSSFLIQWPAGRLVFRLIHQKSLNSVRALAGPAFPWIAKAFKVKGFDGIPESIRDYGDVVLSFRRR